MSCNSFVLTGYLLLFLLVYTDSVYSKVHYYIRPSLNVGCGSGDYCLTLAQFSADSTSYLGNETNISLSFLPGNHSLDRELSLSHTDNFSMTKNIRGNGTVYVECGSQSGGFNISETISATIKSLHFIGCGDNRVNQVEQFIVEDTIFQGVESRGTALVLKEVSAASITRCFFLSNTHGSAFEQHNITLDSKTQDILNHVYLNQNASLATGGALYVAFSNVSVVSSKFTDNTAEIGGSLFAHNSSLHIVGSTYSYNGASFGGVMVTSESSVNIDNSTFSENTAEVIGGVMITYKDSFSISGTMFKMNSAGVYSGVMETYESSFSISNSTFNGNKAEDCCGVIYADNVSFSISSSTFTDNSASGEYLGGGVFDADISSFDITSCNFTNNSAGYDGGIVLTFNSSFNIISSTFTNNSAACIGGIAYATSSLFNIDNSSFYANKANKYGGIVFTIECSTHINDGIFDHNLGSFYMFNSNLTFSGYTKLENCMEPSNKINTEALFTQPRQEGGAITSIRSTVIFTGVSSLYNNQARCGGAILATESRIVIFGEATIANNTAKDSSGGGISLQQSDLEIKGNCTISGNHAMRGGGVHATSSTVAVYQPGTLLISSNRAENGSGLHIEMNAKLYVLKPQVSQSNDKELLIFTDNHAKYGGAIYVADNINSGACSPDNECFIQTLALYHDLYTQRALSIFFSDNSAGEQGANLFGGLLDRCTPSPFAEVYMKQRTHYSGVSYLGNISNITALDTISSLPVRICFCKSDSEPDCRYQPPTIKVKKGEAFTVSLVAVDQVNHSVDANIMSSLSSKDGGFSEGQQTQHVERSCSTLTFNAFSPHLFETIYLFADGPCGSSILSIRRLDIQFTNCTCPVGFEPSDSETRCECICDSKLSSYITDCNSTTESLVRVNTNSWITYINDTGLPGYVIHPNCPFDYCQPPTENVSMNLNLPNGADAQCAYDRSGVLCGACQKHLSLSLGSSSCLPCHSHWPAVLVVIPLAAIIAGILLVTAVLALNMTVAVGLINGFIFYANIVAANSAVFFPSSEPSFPTVFVAWLNLDIGIDVCFFDGLDAYTKTWLQLAFPVYIIFLVITVIIVSEYSPRFARLIGKKDPVATLATLILLSYAKLLSVTITALSFAVLDYPDNSQETVWLPDGNVKYFQGKHIALVFMALLIILIGVPYTILFFLWQWLVHAPKWKVFKWTRNTKLNVFISVHHVPYNGKFRYWTGLLLLVRVVLYITSSVTVSGDPQSSLLITSILVGSLFLLKEITGARVYKKSFVNIVETVLYFNLLALSSFSWYHFKTDIKKQTAVAYTSTIITFILLVGVIVYHVALLVRKDHPSEKLEEYPLTPVQSAKDKVTHSFIEIPKPHDQSPPLEVNTDETEVKDLTATPVYQ